MPTPAPSYLVSTPIHGVVPTRIPSSNDADYPLGTDSPTLQPPNLFHHIDSFVAECNNVLLSPEFVEDNIVSQIEFASFLMNRCRAEGLCEDSSKVSFEQLDLQLQLDFILGACGDGTVECIGELEADWRNGTHFGFDAEDEDIENSVDKLCMKAYDYAISMGLVNTLGKNKRQTVNLSLYHY